MPSRKWRRWAPARDEDWAKDQDKDEQRRRARFAEGIARAEFGRHYWSGRLEAELQKSKKKKRTDK